MGRSNKPRPKAPRPPANANISIVLVEPQSSGNVGSTARAMKNTGFSDLVLINPCDYKNNESYSMACKADGVLAEARVFPDLKSYLNEPAILFGREDRGLLNEEIPVCDMLLEIPTSEEYPSVNLSHAVFTVCYHLFSAQMPRKAAIKAAPKEEVEQMYDHMGAMLKGIGYGDKGGGYLLEAIMRRFRRLFGRTGLRMKAGK